jgi:hypothetical protein
MDLLYLGMTAAAFAMTGGLLWLCAKLEGPVK